MNNFKIQSKNSVVQSIVFLCCISLTIVNLFTLFQGITVSDKHFWYLQFIICHNDLLTGVYFELKLLVISGNI